MNLLLIVVGVIASAVTAVVTREIMLWLVVQPIRLESETRLEQLRAAQTDVNLVKAIRAGDIDADDLAQIGVLDDASDEDPPALTAEPDLDRQVRWAQSLVASRTKQPRNPYEDLEPGSPRFVPSFYKRDPPVQHLDPGDEVWVDSAHICHTEDGSPVALYTETLTEDAADGVSRARLRVYTDGSLELGTYPDDLIGGRVGPAQRYRPIARVVNLDTDEIREVTQTSKDDTPGRHPWTTDD